MSEPISLAGRSVVITGASRGIGRGIARVFSRAGANLVLVARGQQGLDAVVGELDASRSFAVAGDVRSAQDLRRAVQAARERFGRLDAFCHVAGVYPEGAIEDIDPAEWHQVIDTNLTSTLLVTKECIPVMREQNYGRIVLISSITGVRTGFPGLSAYSASKAGMLGFMRTAALELAPFQVTINAIEPGSIRTEGLDGLGQDKIASMIKNIPLGSLGEPEDVAYTALFLASDGARFITGQTVVVDGGQTLPEIPIRAD
jgi:3-oxoacyl-[acyl-carrier protein] reductase